jgi:CHASE3 domain sensor protein
MKQGLLESLKNARDEIDKIIERDIDSENDVREDLADPKDLEKYIKDLEKLSQKFKDLVKEIIEIREDKSKDNFNYPSR